ncbi:UNVERIFIED_CONTAM: hypothetical protein PYX00_000570 [Menopon gallinae]|uniref:Ubiquitin-like protein ATG12 n=1 Tax=Menopon gallinae TaxID=328185 RepID=A0AAW2IAW7_9NEOP
MSEENVGEAKDNENPDGDALKTENLILGPAGDETTAPKTDTHKVDILLKATGNAPIMKKKRWAVDQERNVGWVIEFIKKYLRVDPSENLFLYVNQSFAPSPDQIIKNLYDCFGADGKLILHYCKSQAWG